MDSVIHISAPAAVVLIIGFFAVVFAFGRMLLGQFEKRMTEQLHSLKTELARETTRIDEITTRLQDLSLTLPLEYVRREDWIRFSAGIDTKLDRLHELVRGGFRQ